jgi:hypothetical protein
MPRFLFGLIENPSPLAHFPDRAFIKFVLQAVWRVCPTIVTSSQIASVSFPSESNSKIMPPAAHHSKPQSWHISQ